MRWEDTANQTCSIARSMSIFGDRWTLLVIRQVFMRVRRFSEIQATLGISKHRLSDRLTRLVDEGVLEKVAYDAGKTRFEYRLTEKGLDLYPILVTIAQWGDKWMADEDGRPFIYRHNGCEHPADPIVCCAQCGEPINAHNCKAEIGPGIMAKLTRGEFTKEEQEQYSALRKS